MAKTRELDDRQSDAATVALAVRSACHRYYTAAPREELAMVTQVVLSVRSWDRQKSPAPEVQIEAWVNCVVSQIRELDDHVSAPAVIAAAIIPHCHTFYSGKASEEISIVIAGIAKVREQRARTPVIPPPASQPPSIYNRL
jgi:ribosomal protein L31